MSARFRRIPPFTCLCIALVVAAVTDIPAAPLQPETREQIEKKLEENPRDLALLSTKGAMQRQAQDYRGAIATYGRILQIAPDDVRAHNLLVMVLHRAAQTLPPDEALPLLSRAVALAPDADFLKPAYIKAAQSAGSAKELIKAYESLPEGYELAAPTLIAVADAYRETGKLAEAVAIYRPVLEVAPANADAGLGLALALLDSQQYPEALETIQHTISLYPERPTLLLALAAIQWQSNAYVLALDTFDRILELDPAHADAVNLKAQLLCDMGCISLAQEVVAQHPALIWKHVRDHVASCVADMQTAWSEGDSVTNTLPPRTTNNLLALCYYDVSDRDTPALTAISSSRFLQHIEYLRTHGYHFVSAGNVLAAQRGQSDLPDNAVLLTFDHGYRGFIEHVLPVLEIYNIPAIVSFCPAWIENGPPMDLSGPLLSWDQIAMLGGHRLLTLGIEAEGLFELVNANPQGDAGFAATTHIYDPTTQHYETAEEQRTRIQTTLSHALRLTKDRAEVRPRVLVWSHGARNAPAAAEAERLGFALQLSLRARPNLTNTEKLERIPILHDPSIGSFIALIKAPPPTIEKIRAVAVSMDTLDDVDEHVVESRIAQLVQRLRVMGANTVILTACADANRDDTVEAAYFPTGQLPVLHDILDHTVARLQRERLRVWLELPVLSFLRPVTPRNEAMRVMELHDGDIRPSFSVRKRYSPFHPDVVEWTAQLYRDLAEHVRCNGIVFGEDAYLTDSEDYNRAAQRIYAARLGTPTPGRHTHHVKQQQAWTRLKTDTLNRMTIRLADEVQRLRPRCKTARALFAPLLHYPESERWFAQNVDDTLALYDYLLLLAYPEMEDIRAPEAWLGKLVDLADRKENGLEKTIFKIQAIDWRRSKPVKTRYLHSRLHHLTDCGALNVAYGPDDPVEDVPRLKRMKQALGAPTQPRK